MIENKPFIFGVATSGDNFTDRKEETKRLLQNFQHGVNTVLISPRRWGKTSLVQKVCHLAQSDKLKVVYLDIFSCRSDKDFYDTFAAAVLKQTSSKLDEWLENVKLFQFIQMIYSTSASFLLYCGSTFHPLFSFFLFFSLRFLSQ